MPGVLRSAAFHASLAVWARWVVLLARGRDLGRLVARVRPGPGTPYAGMPAELILAAVTRACRRPRLMRDRRCLREGLLAFRFLCAAGYRPRLHFGVDRASAGRARMAAHCWITLDGAVVLNPPLPGHVEMHVVEPG